MNLPLPQDRRQRRAGFTLVELLIVLGIILILMSLLIAGVAKVATLGKRTTNTNDLRQLESSVVNFTQQTNSKYVPSRIFLAEDLSQYNNPSATCMMGGTSYPVPPALIAESKAYLQRLFPKLVFPSTYPQTPTTYPQAGFVDWNGDGSYVYPSTTTTQSTILEGDQCLVFFLGGIPVPPATGTPGVTGFSTNPRDPSWHVTKGGSVIGPFFPEFKSGRLADRSGQGFYSYLDAYSKQPFLYFSNFGNRNGYNRYTAVPNMPTAGGLANNTSDYNVVVGTQVVSFFPYAEGQLVNGSYRYLRPDGFQIISAGADAQFGPGTNPTASPVEFWSDAQGFQPFKPDVGLDDQTNFSGVMLGDAGS